MDDFNPDSMPERDVDDDVYLRPGDAIDLGGKLFVVQSRSPRIKGYIFSDPLTEGSMFPMSSAEIKARFNAEKLSFVSRSEYGLKIGVRESLVRTMSAFRHVERKEMLRRLRYCLAVDAMPPDFGRSSATMQPVCDAVALERDDTGAHSWASVYRWWQDWVRAGRDVRALCPSTRRRGNRERKVPDYQLAAMKTAIATHWNRRHRPKMSTAYNACVKLCIEHHGGAEIAKEKVRPWPSLETFRAECRRQNRAVTLSTRFGPEAARHAMYPVGMGPDVRMPFERVEADFKFLRLYVVDDQSGLPLGTPYLMAGIDCYSGCVAGFDIGFDPPSYASVSRCLRHIIDFKDLDKFPKDEDGRPVIRRDYPINGVPQKLVLDNDVAFHADSLRHSAIALGTNIHFVPPGQPWEKGHIERFWGTLQTTYLDMFPGKVLRLAQEAGPDYDPAKDAVITMSQLRLFITKAIVDVHHEGIDEWTGKRRIDLWQEGVATNPPRPVRDHQSLLELVGAFERRSAERRGIRLHGLRYNSPQLAQYRSGFATDPMVEVRYDPQDISTVWVIDSDRGISFPVPCTRVDYAAGLSEHQHRVIRRHAADRTPAGRIRMAELIISKAELFALGEAMLRTRRTKTMRRRIAQFLGLGRDVFDKQARRIHDPKGSVDPLDLEDMDDADFDSLTDKALERPPAKQLEAPPPAATSSTEARTADPAPPGEQAPRTPVDANRPTRKSRVTYDE